MGLIKIYYTTNVLDELLDLIPSLPTSIRRIIHVGTNDTTRQESERIKRDFNLLFTVLKNSGKSVFISGPIPTLGGKQTPQPSHLAPICQQDEQLWFYRQFQLVLGS